MPTFYDSEGNSYVLNEQIGRGGEGAVFACPNDFNLVAKIYHEPISDEKAEKLRWMAENKNDQLLKVAAWIVDTLQDENEKVVGFLMPNVKAKEIHELYSLKSRRVHFPDATWKFLIHAATNVARAFFSLHKNRHIMGDVNHGNCVVLKDGTVKLIDCDSYSISRGDFRYRCEVGVATHLAPELQGVDLGEVERENKHDNFGLAVIIFQLLFLGRHPFAGNYLGDEDKSLEDCIREYRFAYSTDAHLWKVKQPPGTLSLSAVTPQLARMFERAFLSENRPEPREWIEALEDLSQSLKQCSLHVGHFYFDELRSCPWCEIESKTGLMLFPFVSGNRVAGEDNFNIFTIENLVSSLAIPQNLPVKPPKPNILPSPSPEIQTKREERLSRFIILVVLHLFVVSILTIIAGAGAGFFISAIVMVCLIGVLSNSNKEDKNDLEYYLEKARKDWSQLQDEWTTADSTPQFSHDLLSIKQKISEHQTLQHQSREKIKLLRDEVFHYKLDIYLASFKIADAKILGLRRKNLDLLQNFGIRSAADIEAKRLNSLPPIDEEIKEKAIEWRKNLERNFEYHPDNELPAASLLTLTHDFTEKRGRIEREIENLLVGLRSGSTLLRQRQQHLSARAETVAKSLLQSQSDLSAVGNIAAPVVILILITIFIPLFGNVFSSANSTQTNFVSQQNKARIANTNYGIGQGFGIGSGSPTNTASGSISSYVVPNNLSDKEIESLPDYQKEIGAQQLLERAEKLADVEKNYKKAEQILQLALKLAPNDTKIMNKIGNVLFERKKYKESLVYLNRSLLLEPQNADTKFLVGINYLKMLYFEDAQRIFSDLAEKSPQSFEVNFNLGQAYKGLHQYYSAIISFRKAIEIKPDSADTHYENAVCLHKFGSDEEVIKEYQTLLELDPQAAEKLRKNLGLKKIPVVGERNTGIGYGSGNGGGM